MTGTENQTVILLVVPTGALIEFDGQNYTETKLIYMSLNKYETIQLQSKDDLTGTYIISSHPIADDGDDNDCDGRVDEEVDDGSDNDGDGRIDEDLQTV
ncbi:uncharacterized protein LOC126828063 [Patella vulgata]|uniref:uncharacterized protein LOC126828063 n=1 Tax=Patella vulgata TaxID=6465 RepID=UPI00218041F2|nr:uncharacterized protein LOC126828063 [Patella vulgata]